MRKACAAGALAAASAENVAFLMPPANGPASPGAVMMNVARAVADLGHGVTFFSHDEVVSA